MTPFDHPIRRADDVKWYVRFGRATRTVLPPAFACAGLAVFLYHGFGVHQFLVRDLTAAAEEPGWILVVIYILCVSTAFGAEHFDKIALALAQRISGSRAEISEKIDATVRTITEQRDHARGIDPA